MKCPKCNKSTRVGRSTSAGYRICRRCSIKWRLGNSKEYVKVLIPIPKVPGC